MGHFEEKALNIYHCDICLMAEKVAKLFTDHPLIGGIAFLGIVVGIFYALGIKDQELAIVTFVIVVVEMVIYFDARDKQLEKRIENLEKKPKEQKLFAIGVKRK